MKSQDASDELARAVAVNALVIGQVFYLLNSRYKLDSSLSLETHLGNRYLALGIGAVVILQCLFTYAPPLQALFETEAIPLRVWPWLALGGLAFFLVVEAEKLIIRSTRAGGAPLRRPREAGPGEHATCSVATRRQRASILRDWRQNDPNAAFTSGRCSRRFR